jgi:AcrR family transcriptional regulator
MTEKYHQPAHVRREQILQAAVTLAARDGYPNIKRDEVAQRAGVAAGSVNLHFSTMTQLRRDVVRYAVTEANKVLGAQTRTEASYRNALLRVIAQALSMKDRHAAKATDAVKKAALESV